MIDVKTKEQYKELMEKERILIDFYADWCGPCKMMEPILEDVTNIEVARVNIDNFRTIAEKERVLSIPTFKIMGRGKVVKEKTGFMTREEFDEFIK
ncbi:MAG: thioredoxin family protein [Bacilli bacterium]|nr:thioredoxin family protein [Bacilli bacterium]